MGCFSFINSWYVKRKESRRERRRLHKEAKANRNGKTPTPSPRQGDDTIVKKQTKGGLAFDVGFEQEPRNPKVPPHLKPKKNVVDSVEQKALLADIKRREALIKKGDDARQSQRKREVFAAKRAELEQEFKDKARAIVDNNILPDNITVKDNLTKLHKRCKTARRRKQITTVLTHTPENKEGGETTIVFAQAPENKEAGNITPVILKNN